MPEFQYSRKFHSSLDEVNAQVVGLLSILDSQFEAYNRFGLDLVLREALNNSVLHGNRNQPEQLIQLRVSIVNDQFKIEVEDQGQGFDWQAILKKESDPEYDHGRGFPIFQMYCQQIELNQVGNKISLRMNLYKPKT